MSDTVKLIIELPIDKYLSVKTNMINDFIYDAVKHGILLDEVKAEIRGMGYHMIDYGSSKPRRSFGYHRQHRQGGNK